MLLKILENDGHMMPLRGHGMIAPVSQRTDVDMPFYASSE